MWDSPKPNFVQIACLRGYTQNYQFQQFLGAHSLRVTTVKFGVRVRTGTPSPKLNFVKKNARGMCPLVATFYQKFEIFTIFST